MLALKMLQQLPLFLSIFSILSIIFFDQLVSATSPFIYGGCSQVKFAPGTPYDLNVNALFTSLVNGASISSYNNVKISPSGSSQSNVVYGLFQCEGDLSNSICRDCVANSISQLKSMCPGATGGVIQIEGCFVKYDNTSFFGVDQDKTEVSKRCGPSIGYNSDALNRRDGELAYLTTTNGQYFRRGGSGSVQGVAQCVQDLSVSECQDCLQEASARLRSECETSTWGDMFLGKCYIRYVDRQHHHSTDDDEDVDKTLALTIGVITGVILLIVFISSLSKSCGKKGGK